MVDCVHRAANVVHDRAGSISIACSGSCSWRLSRSGSSIVVQPSIGGDSAGSSDEVVIAGALFDSLVTYRDLLGHVYPISDVTL